MLRPLVMLLPALGLLATALPARTTPDAADDPAVFVVPSREVPWSELTAGAFDPAWMLPDDDPTGFLALVAELQDLSL
ncbi:MAG: hypothetical protein ACYTG2_17300, partial [Planctomycetota bacterium]